MTGSGRGVDLSVVVPMFNEQEVLPLFYLRLRTALDQLDISYEVVAVDDGSRDDTARLTESERDDWPELRLVRWGVAIARKGMVQKKHVLSCFTRTELLAYLAKRKRARARRAKR